MSGGDACESDEMGHRASNTSVSYSGDKAGPDKSSMQQSGEKDNGRRRRLMPLAICFRGSQRAPNGVDARYSTQYSRNILVVQHFQPP